MYVIIFNVTGFQEFDCPDEGNLVTIIEAFVSTVKGNLSPNGTSEEEVVDFVSAWEIKSLVLVLLFF